MRRRAAEEGAVRQDPRIGPSRLGRAAWVVLLVPAWLLLSSAHAVWTNFSPAPFSDQWANISALRDAPKIGWLTYLFAQHNEHRILVPRLVFLADWAWFRGRNALDLAAIGAIQLAGAALFVRAALSRPPTPLALLALAAATAMIFSLAQWENLFWGFQVCFVAVNAAAAWAIYLFCQAAGQMDRVRWRPLVAALALLLVATFSMVNGVSAGLAMVMVGLAARMRPAAILAAAAATAILLAVYLHGYYRLDQHSPLSLAVQHPGRFVFYVAIYLGNLWAPGRPGAAALMGLAGIAASLGMLVVIARKDGRDPVRAALFGIVLFVGMGAAATCLGRLVLGVGQAMASRYTTPTAYFWAAHAVFWALTLQRRSASSPPAPLVGLAAWARAGLAALLVLAMGFIVSLQRHGEWQLADLRNRVLAGSSALVGGVDDPEALRNLHPDTAYIQTLAPHLRTVRKSLFADPPAARAGERFSRPLAPPDACRGAFDILVPQTEGRAWRGAGWGWDREAGRSFPQVVLVDGAGQVLGLGLSSFPRRDVPKVFRDVRSDASGWVAILRPAPDGQVVAYGITATGQACEIGRKTWER